MAVQAALLSAHPFVPFGFGGAPDGLDAAFGALDKDCCFEDDEPGLPAGAEGGDVREATRDLLSFIDSASSNIKLALDKPGKSKRKVNHRKYLQKQIKRCSGLMGTAPPGPPSPSAPAADAPARRAPGAPTAAAAPGKVAPRREAAQAAAASLQSRSLAALFDPLRQSAGGSADPSAGLGAGGAGGDAGLPAGCSAAPGARKVPLRARNLPPSFFTEPSRGGAGSGGGGGAGGPSGPCVSLGELEKGAEAAEFLELLAPDFGACADGGALLPAEPLDVFPAGLRAPPELEAGLFEAPPPAMVGSLLYPEPWSASTKKTPLAPSRGGLTLNEPLRALYPADSAGGEDAPGLLASFAPFFADGSAAPPPHPAPYDYGAAYGRAPFPALWRSDAVWEAAPGEQGAPRD